MPEKEKIEFIKKHGDEIKQVVSDQEAIKKLEAGEAVASGRVENALEQFETKIFLFKKKESKPEAKKVLVTASETMAFNLMNPIIERLKKDERCKVIGLFTDLIAGKMFKDPDFQRIDNKELPVLADAMKTAEKELFDVAITAVESANSPNEVVLFGGKSVFGAEKLYVMIGGWIGFGSDVILSHPERQKYMESIDGIFCNDELAKRVIHSQYKEFPENRIFATGTPTIDDLELEKSAEYAESGRDKLEIEKDALAVLYLGDSSPAYRRAGYDTDEKINEKTFEKTLDAMIKVAEEEPQKKFSFMVRPHPADTNSQELFDIIGRKELPPNLKVVSAEKSKISMQESIYAADIAASIVSNENFLASLCGKKAIFLGYEDKGFGSYVMGKTYSREIIEAIDQDKNIDIVSSPRDFLDKIKQYRQAEIEQSPRKEGNSVDRILDIILR